jgi:4-amino-4-deoxychorismate lyase
MASLSEFIITDTPSLKSRALNYGDGCFTTMLSRFGKVELLDLHVKRLINDAQKLQIINDDFQISEHELTQFIEKTAANGNKNLAHVKNAEWQIVKLLVIRGDSDRGYSPSLNSRPIIIPSVQDYRFPAKSSISLAVADMKLAEQSILAGIKHLNRLEQVMAKIELSSHDKIDDLILTNVDGIMIELTTSNLFYYIDGKWHTPSLEKSGVNGVARQFILNHMDRRNIPCVVSEMNVSALAQAESAFSCNAVTKVMPISDLKLNGELITFNTQLSRDFAEQISQQVALECQ